MQELLRLLLSLKKPGEILEIGAATGFSAIFMAEYSQYENSKANITTIEKYAPRLAPLKENIRASGFSERIRVIEGEALKAMGELIKEGASYDLIFMDAAKAQYIHFLPSVLTLLRPDGVLVSDNVLQDGELIESRFAVERRNRTIHARMRDYLFELTHHPSLVTNIFPIADGVTVSVRR
ncbi:MAG: O-methyltransferase [Lachnospiraceae bacterium]|nr:O-methyltransferase [Lachnospiraceae bacterium]